ncbi:MAG: hypothetical protein UX06_C0015G0003 [Candidatus Giovannonibacteria bacterium GW2011_GWA2_45_21]|uniref:Uncharacterized protein n=1 Tax=Candidatus Giovannonibacteria bacterium GW2011_GWA2_45_21 TaxID=1618649 RepID=A0A0G1M8C9_9BACT|nr:MAG: hypothetical protein UX06_C0015G0003 [Candidatus Giovannonibacteria bacterium GW2011_GWA2_45_21]
MKEETPGIKDSNVISKEAIEEERLERFFEGTAGIEELLIFYTDFDAWASRYNNYNDENDPSYSPEKKGEIYKKFETLWEALIERMAVDDNVYDTAMHLIDSKNGDDPEIQKGLKDKIVYGLVSFLRKKVKELRNA